MLNPLVIPLPLAAATLAALAAFMLIANALLKTPEPPNPWAGQSWATPTRARHRLADVTDPYRPGTAAPRPVVHHWTTDELDEALDAAERVAAEMAATERGWAAVDTRELTSV